MIKLWKINSIDNLTWSNKGKIFMVLNKYEDAINWFIIIIINYIFIIFFSYNQAIFYSYTN